MADVSWLLRVQNVDDLQLQVVAVTRPDPRLESALAFYRSGRAKEAERICFDLLRGNPRHVGTLTLLGAIKSGQDDHEAAVTFLRRALNVAPAAHRTLSNLGLSLRSLGRPEEALECFTNAVRLAPDYAVAWYNQGVVLRDLQRLEAALEAYDRAIASNPAFADAIGNRGDVLYDLGHFDAALASFDRSIALRPDHAESHAKRAAALRRLGDLTQALASLHRAITLAPQILGYRFERGKLLSQLGRYEEAIADFDDTLAVDTGHVHALSHRGAALLELRRYDEAELTFQRAVALDPSLPQLWINLGQSQRELGAFGVALKSYQRAAEIDPTFADAHWNIAFSCLLLGDFEAGLREYEWRWRTPTLGLQARETGLAPWLGETSLEGKEILIHAEQGYGDTVQMARYAQELSERGATVTLEVPSRLATLLKTVPGVSRVVRSGDPSPSFECHCPIMSLPFAFGTRLETIPNKVPYIRTDPALVAQWSARLGPRRNLRIGVMWSGNPIPPKRSIPLDEFSKLFDLPLDFISLQREVHPSDETALRSSTRLRHFGAAQHDFADLAALVESMDLIISVDTVTAHIAGAMGKPVWILLPYSPDWRWLVDRRDSPWYPTAELFRQSRPWDWGPLLEEVRARLMGESNSMSQS